MEELKSETHKGIVGVRVIQTNFWRKRVGAFDTGRRQLLKLKKDPEFIAGLMLYWAEGSKSLGAEITNSDVNLIVFMVSWFEKYFNVSPLDLAVQMHIHSGQNLLNMRQYWSRATKIPISNFQQHYTKRQGSGHRKKRLYYGTAKIRVRGQGSTYLLFQILGAIAEYNYNVMGVKVDVIQWIRKPRYAE